MLVCEPCKNKHEIAIPRPRNFRAARCNVCKKYSVCFDGVPEANVKKKK